MAIKDIVNKMNKDIFLNELLANGKTQFHVVEYCKEKLINSGYRELNFYDTWDLEKKGRYFTSPFSSMLVAFSVGEENCGLRICAAHTDFPTLKLKFKPELFNSGYLQANVEPYGGMIKESFFDRPLGVAGKLVLKSDKVFSPSVRLYDSEKPLFIIPNLAPHLKKDTGKQEIDIQKEMLPIGGMALSSEKNPNYLIDYICKDAGINREELLDFDLYLYVHALPSAVGLSNELLAGARIDNISSCAAITQTLCSMEECDQTVVGVLFDNEEIGSRSKQGADSMLFEQIIRKITCDNTKLMENAFCMSIDVAHAYHPNYPEKNDITSKVILGNGVVLKSSASQRYVTDSESGAVIIELCRENDIKLQRQVNRSGMPGGQTLGPIMSSYLPIRCVDIGMPILAMHSACELAHKSDYTELTKLINAYFNTSL